MHLHNEMLVIGDGELLKREHRATALLSRHTSNIVVGAQRKQHLLLHGGLLGDLFVQKTIRIPKDFTLLLTKGANLVSN